MNVKEFDHIVKLLENSGVPEPATQVVNFYRQCQDKNINVLDLEIPEENGK